MRNDGYAEMVHGLKELAGWTCLACGYCGSNPLDHANILVHHKDGNPFNDDITNLVVLCDGCHNKITWLDKHKDLLDKVDGLSCLSLRNKG